MTFFEKLLSTQTLTPDEIKMAIGLVMPYCAYAAALALIITLVIRWQKGQDITSSALPAIAAVGGALSAVNGFASFICAIHIEIIKESPSLVQAYLITAAAPLFVTGVAAVVLACRVPPEGSAHDKKTRERVSAVSRDE